MTPVSVLHAIWRPDWPPDHLYFRSLLAAAPDGELTQCQFRGCPPGTYVWLVLQQGPPGSFPHPEPLGLHQPPGADAWSLSPIDATTGVARGDTEIGAAGLLRSSPWWQLHDLAPPH